MRICIIASSQAGIDRACEKCRKSGIKNYKENNEVSRVTCECLHGSLLLGWGKIMPFC